MRLLFEHVFIAILLTSCISGCVKRSCCGYPVYHYDCASGSNTKAFIVTGPGSSIQNMVDDSLSFYQAQGYTCSLTGPPYTAACVFGEAKIKKAIKDGDICVDPVGSAGSCGPEPGTSCE